MRRLRTMTIANLKMSFRARQALFWNLAFPVILLTLLGLVFGKGTTIDITVGVVGNGPVASAARHALGEIKGVTLKEGIVDEELQALKAGNRDAVLVIPQGQPTPGKPLPITLYYDQTNLGTGSAVVALVSQVVQDLNQRMSGAAQLLALNQQGIAAASNNYIDYLVPGIIGVSVMTSCITGIASRLVGYRQQRILKRLRATPLATWEFVGSNVISQMVIVLAQVLLLVSLATLVFGVHVAGSMALVIGLAFLGGLAFLTIGFALSGLAATVEAAGALANVVTMPMMFLSGVYFPVTNAPNWLKPLINILPLTYLANGLRDVMEHGQGLSTIGVDIMFLVITAIVGFGVAARTFRWE